MIEKQLEIISEKNAASPALAGFFLVIGLILYFFILQKGYRINPVLFFTVYLLSTSVFYFNVGFHLFYHRILLIAYVIYFLVAKALSPRSIQRVCQRPEMRESLNQELN